jgi:hypothetical protein
MAATGTYNIGPIGVEGIFRKINQRKVSGAVVQPWMYNEAIQAGLDVEANKAIDRRKLSLSEATLAEEQRANIAKERLASKQMDVTKAAGVGQLIGQGVTGVAGMEGLALLDGKPSPIGSLVKKGWNLINGVEKKPISETLSNDPFTPQTTPEGVAPTTETASPYIAPDTTGGSNLVAGTPEASAATKGMTADSGMFRTDAAPQGVETPTAVLAQDAASDIGSGAAGSSGTAIPAGEFGEAIGTAVDAGEVAVAGAETAGSAAPMIGPAITAGKIVYDLATGDYDQAVSDTPIVGEYAGAEKQFEQGNWGEGTAEAVAAPFMIDKIPGGKEAMDSTGKAFQGMVENIGQSISSVVSDSCIIVTACCGRDSEEVDITRRFRDKFMTKEQTRGYYMISQELAPMMKANPLLCDMIKTTIVDHLIEYGKSRLGMTKTCSRASMTIAHDFLKGCQKAGKTADKFIRSNGEEV